MLTLYIKFKINVMKKLTLLLSMLLCYFLGYSQILYPTVSVIESGDILTINAAGETDASYFSGIFMPNMTGIIESSPDVFASGYVSIIPVGYVTYYNITTKTPTTFKIQFKNNHPINDYTIKLKFLTVTNGTTSVTADKTINIKIKHAPPLPLTYYNDALSKSFKKNNCGPGFEGSDVTYLVPEKKYSSDISKEDANAKAQAEINANGQNKANTEGQCFQLFYNIEKTGLFSKNDCSGENVSGPPITHSVAAGVYSGKSQVEADQKAQNALNTEGQSLANAQGTCVPFIYYKKLVMENVTTDPDIALHTADFYVEIYADAALTIPLTIASNSITINYQEKKISSSVGYPNPTTTLINRTKQGYKGDSRVHLGNFEIVNCPPVPSENDAKKTAKGLPGGGGNYPCITREYSLL